jgi:hypothetical protein
MLILLLLARLGLAQDPEPAPPPDPDPDAPKELPKALQERDAPPDVRIVLRGVLETWSDPYVASRFRSGGPGMALGAVIPIIGPLAVDAEISYQRMKGDGEGVFQLMPVSLLAEFRWTPSPDRGLELFGALGPHFTMWSESGQDPDYMRSLQEDPEQPPASVLRGMRPGVELRLGTRVTLGWMQPSLAPAPKSPLKDVELEIHVARRFAPTSSGFNLNAWRAGVGLALVF